MNRKQLPAAPVFNKIFCVHAKNDDLKEADWRECFSQYGDINSVHIARNKQTKQPTGYTYIEFNKTSEACIAMEEMDNNTVKPNTRTIRVHLAHKKEDNLEIDVDLDKMLERLCVKHSKQDGEDELREHFSQFGNIIRMNVLKDKQTREPIGITFIKYSKQSETGMALEECDQKFRPRWADVRSQDPAKIAMKQAAEGYDDGYGMGYGGMGLDDPMGFPMPSRALAMAEAQAVSRFGRLAAVEDRLGGLGAMRDPFRMASNGAFEPDSGPKVLEAMVPPSMTRQQVFKLFDIAQGMVTCDLQTETGLARVEYNSGKNAAHAKEKVDGLDIFGQTIAIRFAKNQMANRMANLEEKAMKLEEQLRQMRNQGGVDPERMNFLVQSLSEVTHELKRGGTHGGAGGMERGGGGGGGAMSMVPWCNQPIPPPQAMLPRNTPQNGKCFIVTTPDAVSNEMLRNLFCRFGNLIMCGYQPGKRFGFANYGNMDSAQKAIDTLNGASLWHQGQEMLLKVEMSNQGKENQDGEDGVPRKRSRPF